MFERAWLETIFIAGVPTLQCHSESFAVILRSVATKDLLFPLRTGSARNLLFAITPREHQLDFDGKGRRQLKSTSDRKTNQRKKVRRLWGLGLVVLFCAEMLCQPAAVQAQAQEQALRRRVEEYYSHLQLGRWTEVEAYLTPQSVEIFREESKNAFLGFQIDSITIDPDGQSATGEVRIYYTIPQASTPVYLPKTTHWRLVNGVWYVDLPKPDPERFKNLFDSEARKASLPPSPPPAELKFQEDEIKMGLVKAGDLPVARFPFTNVTDHAVTITEVRTGCKCLRLLTEKKEYQPGESGELAIEFDPIGYSYTYGQAVMVFTNPGELKTQLVIWANVDYHDPEKFQRNRTE